MQRYTHINPTCSSPSQVTPLTHFCPYKHSPNDRATISDEHARPSTIRYLRRHFLDPLASRAHGRTYRDLAACDAAEPSICCTACVSALEPGIQLGFAQQIWKQRRIR